MTAEELIVVICREAGDVDSDEEIIEGYLHNYQASYIEEVVTRAAAGDVGSLLRMRTDAGLPAIV